MMDGTYRKERKEVAGKRAWTLEVQGKRSRGRPKLRWKDTVTKDMEEKGLT